MKEPPHIFHGESYFKEESELLAAGCWFTVDTFHADEHGAITRQHCSTCFELCDRAASDLACA